MHNPSEQAYLGTQWRCVVNIVDDDLHRAFPSGEVISVSRLGGLKTETKLIVTNKKKYNEGEVENLFIVAESDRLFHLFSFFAVPTLSHDNIIYDLEEEERIDDEEYKLHVFKIAQGGLVGNYFSDMMLSDFEKSRVDAVVNFTWSESLVQSVRWNGLIQSNHSKGNCCVFYVTGKNVRFWINRYLIIDEWDLSLEEELQFSGYYSLQPKELVELMIEIRDINVKSSINLMWSGDEQPQDVVPAQALYWKVRALISKYYLSNTSVYVSACLTNVIVL